MEPRPQSSRSAHEQAPAGPAPAGAGAQPHQPDPTTIMAPPRADYDYSPLDLAPPGQRRRRQLVAAVLGGLVVLLLAAAMVFAFLVLDDDDPGGDGGNSIAAAQTEVAVGEATLAAQQTVVAGAVGGTVTATDDPAAGGDDPATEPASGNQDDAASAAGDDAGDEASVDPTPPDAGAAGGGPTESELQAMLPSAGAMPEGLAQVDEKSRSEQDVIDALGGNREAETNLEQWGWTANVERSFQAANPDALVPGATTRIVVSLHGFGSDTAAAEALTYYSDILANNGFQEAEVENIGATNRLLVQPLQDGGTNVALYVQQGPVLYRIGGYSPGGDPSSNVQNVARAMLEQA